MEAKIDENKNEEEAEDDDDLEHEFLTNEKDLGEIDFEFSRRGGNGPVASSSSSSSDEREGDEEKIQIPTVRPREEDAKTSDVETLR